VTFFHCHHTTVVITVAITIVITVVIAVVIAVVFSKMTYSPALLAIQASNTLVPTLFVSGLADELIPPEHMRAL